MNTKNLENSIENGFAISALTAAKEAYKETVDISKSIGTKANILIVAISFLFTGLATYIGATINSIGMGLRGMLICILTLLTITVVFDFLAIYPTMVNSLIFKLPEIDEIEEDSVRIVTPESKMIRDYLDVADSIRRQNENRLKSFKIAILFYIVAFLLSSIFIVVGTYVL